MSETTNTTNASLFKGALKEARTMLLEFFGSKKAFAFVVGSVSVVLLRVAGKHGIVIDQDTAREITGELVKLCMLYLGGQGLADWGKHAAEVKAQLEKVAVDTAIAKLPEEKTP